MSLIHETSQAYASTSAGPGLLNILLPSTSAMVGLFCELLRTAGS